MVDCSEEMRKNSKNFSEVSRVRGHKSPSCRDSDAHYCSRSDHHRERVVRGCQHADPIRVASTLRG
jgi:hypothetical protein